MSQISGQQFHLPEYRTADAAFQASHYASHCPPKPHRPIRVRADTTTECAFLQRFFSLILLQPAAAAVVSHGISSRTHDMSTAKHMKIKDARRHEAADDQSSDVRKRAVSLDTGQQCSQTTAMRFILAEVTPRSQHDAVLHRRQRIRWSRYRAEAARARKAY